MTFVSELRRIIDGDGAPELDEDTFSQLQELSSGQQELARMVRSLGYKLLDARYDKESEAGGLYFMGVSQDSNSGIMLASELKKIVSSKAFRTFKVFTDGRFRIGLK